MNPPKRRRKGGLLGKLSGSHSSAAEVGGSIDTQTRQIDPKDAMLLAAVAVAEFGMERDGKGEIVLAVELRGKINTTGREVNPLVLCSPDGAALLVAQIIGLVRSSRMGPEFDALLAERMKEAIGD
jgi:hypothetical protein